jgi:hydrogenase expression/formation protein HypC
MPRRVLRVQGNTVQVDWDGGPMWADSAGVLALEPGDYVLVHAGLVLDRLSADEAEQILALHASLEGADVSLLVSEPAEEACP